MFHIQCKSQDGVVKSFFPISTPTATRTSQGPAAPRGRRGRLEAPALPCAAVRGSAGDRGRAAGDPPGLAGRGKGRGRPRGALPGTARAGPFLWGAGPGPGGRGRGQDPGAASREQQVGRGRGGAAGGLAAGRVPGGPGAPRRQEGTLSLTSGDDSQSDLSTPRTPVRESQARRLRRVAEETAAD